MKTWTNPTVEELDVKLTANGWIDINLEEFIPGGADDRHWGDPDNSTGWKDDDSKEEEKYPS